MKNLVCLIQRQTRRSRIQSCAGFVRKRPIQRSAQLPGLCVSKAKYPVHGKPTIIDCCAGLAQTVESLARVPSFAQLVWRENHHTRWLAERAWPTQRTGRGFSCRQSYYEARFLYGPRFFATGSGSREINSSRLQTWSLIPASIAGVTLMV